MRGHNTQAQGRRKASPERGKMKAYGIDYTVNGKFHSVTVDAKDIKSAKAKIGKKHGYTTGRMIKVVRVSVIGYF